MNKYIYNDNSYEIRIIKKNNKNTYIRVKNGGIIVTTNYFATSKQIEKLLLKNQITINKMIDKDNFKNSNRIDEHKIFLFGCEYDVFYGYDFNIIDNAIYVSDIKELNKYINKQIDEVFYERFNYWYNIYEEKIPVPNLKIRKMTSRWGVCNLKNNNITLNYELYKYNTRYLDYVIVHELSHFIYPNHSVGFWNQVSKYYPDYKIIRKYLKKVGG